MAKTNQNQFILPNQIAAHDAAHDAAHYANMMHNAADLSQLPHRKSNHLDTYAENADNPDNFEIRTNGPFLQ